MFGCIDGVACLSDSHMNLIFLKTLHQSAHTWCGPPLTFLCWTRIYRNIKTNKSTWNTSRNVLFEVLKSAETRLYPNPTQCIWVDQLVEKPRRPQPLRSPLPFKIIYTNIILVLKSRSACNQKPQYWMILNGKGFNWLWATLVQSCFCSYMTIQYSSLFLNRTFLLLYI